MASPSTKPCPGCAKKLRADASNCWFCGRVFDILRCIECGSPNRTGSPACQICGEPLPSVPLLIGASDAPPVAQRADEQDCPECNAVVPLAAVRCKHCGAELNSPTRQQAAKWSGATVRRSRGGGILAAGVVSLFAPVLAYVPLAFAFTFGGGPFWAVGFAILAFGLFFSTSAVVVAFLDMKAMRLGRRDRDGWGITFTAGVLSGVSVLLHWAIVGYCILSGL